jgi:hypothetical protein
MVLFIVIAGVLVMMAALLGWSMCRVAALSDRDHAISLAEWKAMSYLADSEVAAQDRPGEQIFGSPGKAYRAAG